VPVEKVTAFVLRRPAAQPAELLLIRHPHAGIQLPAGTVEPDESLVDAARREAAEETGLTGLRLVAELGSAEEPLPDGQAAILSPTRVYSRPDPASFDWAHLRRGLVVDVLRRATGFVQVSYVEWDRLPDPVYASYVITGWVPAQALTHRRRRHFYRFECAEPTPATWTVEIDRHIFTLFWAPLDALPPLIAPQDGWLRWLPKLGREAPAA
jgi:8-oxo-dGTP pyrophosphatase MutT (NUDIX family)